MAAIEKNSAKSWLQFVIVFIAGITIAMGMFKVPVGNLNLLNLLQQQVQQISV